MPQKISSGAGANHGARSWRNAARCALSATGCEVLDAGICPTAIAQHEAARLSAGGALSVTASHSDINWNGFKFFGETGRVLAKAEGREILDLWHQGEFARARHDHLGAIRTLDDVIDHYLTRLASWVDTDLIRNARLRVVVDAGNGAGAMVADAYARQLGFERAFHRAAAQSP